MFRHFLLITAAALAQSAAAAELSLTVSSADIELVDYIQSSGGIIVAPPTPILSPPPAATTMDELRLSYGIGQATSVYLAHRQVEDLMTQDFQMGGSLSEADALALGVEMRGPRRAGFAFIVRAEVSSWDLVTPQMFGPQTEASFNSAGVGIGVEWLAADWIALRLDYQQDFVERYMTYGLSFGIRLNLDTADVF